MIQFFIFWHFSEKVRIFSFSHVITDQRRGSQNLIYMGSFFNDNNDDNYRKAVSVSASFLQRLWEDPRLWYDNELHYFSDNDNDNTEIIWLGN